MPFPTATIHSPADQPSATSSTAAYSRGRGRTTESFVREAEYVFLEHELIVPAREHLEPIVRLALQAQQLYFAGVLFEPDAAQLDQFFYAFIRLCAVPAPQQLPVCGLAGVDSPVPEV
jgi:hypothetical protein